MRILMLITELGYGGAESAFLRLAREFARDHQVEIALFQDRYASGSYAATPIASDLPIHLLDDDPAAGLLVRWARRSRRLRALKRSMGADATVSFLSGPNLLNALTGGPGLRLLSIRGSRSFEANASRFQRWLYRWLLDPLTNGRADAVVCVSEGLRREMAGRAAGKFHAITGYVDPEALIASAQAPIEPHLARLGEWPVLVAAGRLSREKGFQHLIPLFAKVREQVSDAKLLLIGDGPLLPDLQALSQAHGLPCGRGEQGLGDQAVIFLGHRSDPNRYFRLARLFVLCSSNEGFPNILVEALASGIAVVAADAPWGAREALGLAADPHNRPFPRAEPAETDYGTLMPRIDRPEYAEQWVRVLVDKLRQSKPDDAAVARRRDRVRQLSCAAAAAKWIQLMQRLTARDTRPTKLRESPRVPGEPMEVDR